MKQVLETVDERQKYWCIHCGTALCDLSVDSDHVPSKTLLVKPYPKNLPTVTVCRRCNVSFSDDEQYVATFLECVLAGSSNPDAFGANPVARTLQRNQRLREDIAQSRIGDRWLPDEQRFANVILKNARGHAYFELGEPCVVDPLAIEFAPLQELTESYRCAFETIDHAHLLPEIGSRLLTRVFTGNEMLDGWIYVQPDRYRYAVMYHSYITVRTILSEYLATEVRWAC